MAQGFYEILGVDHQASNAAIQAAYQDQLAELVRRLRAARRQGADVTILEGQERALKEAVQVLTDPTRRQRYDAYRRASRHGMPDSAESMWEIAKDALVDPLAISSLEVLRQTTDLNIGNPFKVQPKPRKWSKRPAAPSPSNGAMAPVEAASSQPAVSPKAGSTDPSTEITEQIERTGPVPGVVESVRVEPEPTVAPPPAAPEVASTPEPLDDISAIAGRFGLDGRFLMAVRELRKRTLDELANETRISLRYLHAIEGNDFDALPAETFVRGYVKELSRALDINEVDVVEGYLALYRQQRG
jgi:hypothetical protein